MAARCASRTGVAETLLNLKHSQENARPCQRVRPKAGPMINLGGGGIRFSVRKCDDAKNASTTTQAYESGFCRTRAVSISGAGHARYPGVSTAHPCNLPCKLKDVEFEFQEGTSWITLIKINPFG
jgi:hypothetical protein